jgi:hypothetical protein
VTGRQPHRGTVVLALTAAVAALAVGAAACGAPRDGPFVAEDDVPFRLDETTTTSTTTPPTTTTTTIETSTTVPPITVELTTTSTIPSEPVELFYVSGGRLSPYQFPLARGASVAQVLSALVEAAGIADATGTGLRSAIPADAEILVSEVGGIATVDLPEDFFAPMSPPEQRFATGQVVLTLTRCCRGVGLVRFTIEGVPTPVFKGNGEPSEADVPLAEEDFAELLVGASQTVPTTVAPTTSSSAEPPPDDTATPGDTGGETEGP